MIVVDSPLPASNDSTSVTVEGSQCSTGDFDETKSGSLCTPAVRTLAKQYGVDLNDVCGTGKNGRVLREDVLNYAVSKGITEEKLTPSTGSEKYPQGQRSQLEDKIVPLR